MAIVSTDKFYTTELLYSDIKSLLDTYPFLKSDIYGISANSIFRNSSIYIVPMCNPDGVNLVNGAYPLRK